MVCYFGEKIVVVWSNNCISKVVIIIEMDIIIVGGMVDFDFVGIRLELFGRIFSCNMVLDGKVLGGDVVLSEVELFKGGICCNLDLCSDNIDVSDFFSDGVFDLDMGVDFDEVVLVLLIDKEFSGISVVVVDRFG